MMNKTSVSTELYHLLIEATQLRVENRLEEALVIYKSCVEQLSKRADLLALIAHIHFKVALSNANEMGYNYEKAIQFLTDALTLEPGNAALHSQLAEVYTLGTLHYELAAQEYRRALELNPYSISALLGAASLYGLPEDVVTLDEAVKWMEQAIEVNPDNPHFYIRLGDLYQQSGQLLAAQQVRLKSFLCLQPLELDYAQSVGNILCG